MLVRRKLMSSFVCVSVCVSAFVWPGRVQEALLTPLKLKESHYTRLLAEHAAQGHIPEDEVQVYRQQYGIVSAGMYKIIPMHAYMHPHLFVCV